MRHFANAKSGLGCWNYGMQVNEPTVALLESESALTYADLGTVTVCEVPPTPGSEHQRRARLTSFHVLFVTRLLKPS